MNPVLQPYTFNNGATVPNRLAVAPMTHFASDENGHITDQERTFLQNRFRGFGLFIAAATLVQANGKTFAGQPYAMTADDLPSLREVAPDFRHYPEMPEWSDNVTDFVLVNGSFSGRTAPTEQHSPLLGLDIRTRQAQTLGIPAQAGWEYGVLVLKGEVEIDGQTFAQDELAKFACADTAQTMHIRAQAGSHIMLLGGEPLPHPTLIWWNFVADSRESLEKAVADWNGGHPRFGSIDLAGTKLQRLAAPELRGKVR